MKILIRYLVCTLPMLLLSVLAINEVAAEEAIANKFSRGRVCAITKPLSFKQLASGAGYIVYAKLDSIKEKRDENGFMVREVTLDVMDAIKGANTGKMTFKELAALDTPITNMNLGTTGVFFINKESQKFGLTSLRNLNDGFAPLDKDGVPRVSKRVLKASMEESQENRFSLASLLGQDNDNNSIASVSSYEGFKELCNKNQ